MKYLKHIFFWLIVLNYCNVRAQMINKVVDTTFMNFSGKINYQLIKTSDDSLVRHGEASFYSELNEDNEMNTLKKLAFNGAYSNGVKHKNWSFSEIEFKFDVKDVRERRGVYSVDYRLNGKEKTTQLNFSEGIPEGTWKVNKLVIENNQKKIQDNFGEINFKKGIATGDIRYKNQEDRIEIQMHLDDQGFIDGELTLSYLNSNYAKVIEIRQYDHGFLLRIDYYSEKSSEPYHSVVYDDIISKLDSINNNIPGLKYQISSGKGFGIDFNNGYVSEEDIKQKLNPQLKGNKIIEEFLALFTPFIDETLNEQELPTYNFTKRIRYFYPDDERKELERIQPELNQLCEELSSFINEPRNKLYKEKSEQLAQSIAFMTLANKKCQLLQSEINELLSEKYDYVYRPNFYANGIEGLNKVDTVYYRKPDRDSTFLLFDVGVKIYDYHQLIPKIGEYVDKLISMTTDYKSIANDKVKRFKEQDEIDRIEHEMISNQEITDSLYNNFERLNQIGFDNLSFEDKIFYVHYKEHIAPLKDAYLSTTNFDEKVKLGTKVNCYLSTLIDQHKSLVVLGQKREKLDSLFTVYEENPFDDRKFESKILGNIRYKGGEILFRHYIEELLKTNQCDLIPEKIERLTILFTRLEEFVKNHKSEEVIGINRLVRRETVPNRIERILNLSPED